MISRLFIILGILATTQSAFAIRDGTYQATRRVYQHEFELEAHVWTEDSNAGSRQFMRITLVAPANNIPPAYYMLAENTSCQTCDENGDLVLLSSGDHFGPGSVDFVSYKEPIAKMYRIELTRRDGKTVQFFKK